MQNEYTLSGFDRILVNKTNPADVILAVPFNPELKQYSKTILTDLAAATQKLVETRFISMPLPEFIEGVDGVIFSKYCSTIVRAGIDLIGLKIGSKQIIPIEKSYAEELYDTVDVSGNGYKFLWGDGEYFVVNGEYGYLKARSWCKPYQKDPHWIDSYIPLHNLFTDKTSSVVNV